MRTTVLINIPITIRPEKKLFRTQDSMLPCSDREVYYPVTAYLEKTVLPGDEVHCLLLTSLPDDDDSKENISLLKQEMKEALEEKCVTVTYEEIDASVKEDVKTHERLMLEIIRHIKEGEHIILEMTFGQKDVPIVEFVALSFAEKHYHCSIDHLIYGYGLFNQKGVLLDYQLCDLIPIYTLNMSTQAIDSTSPEKALKMLEALVRM